MAEGGVGVAEGDAAGGPWLLDRLIMLFLRAR